MTTAKTKQICIRVTPEVADFISQERVRCELKAGDLIEEMVQAYVNERDQAVVRIPNQIIKLVRLIAQMREISLEDAVAQILSECVQEQLRKAVDDLTEDLST